MSSGTSYFHSHYFGGETYDSKYKVKEEIEDLINQKRIFEDTIISYSLITEPKKFINDEELKECDDISILITKKIREALDELYYINIKLSTLKDMENNWEKMHEKVSINRKEYEVAKENNLPYDYAAIDGDYIYTAKYLQEKLNENENDKEDN